MHLFSQVCRTLDCFFVWLIDTFAQICESYFHSLSKWSVHSTTCLKHWGPWLMLWSYPRKPSIEPDWKCISVFKLHHPALPLAPTNLMDWQISIRCRAIDLVVKCVKPAKSWLPQLGCTDLQFHAVVATRHLASYANVRQKILEKEGQLPLIHLLKTGSAETQSHVARTLAYLAEHPDGSYKVICHSISFPPPS